MPSCTVLIVANDEEIVAEYCVINDCRCLGSHVTASDTSEDPKCNQLYYTPASELATLLRSQLSEMSTAPVREKSLLDKLDDVVPGLARFDAFPKLPSTYRARSESRGFLTLFVVLLAFLLVLNDLAEYVWGWPDYEFSVDTRANSYMNVNVDMVVNTPCSCMY